MALDESLRVEASDEEKGQFVKSGEQCHRKRRPMTVSMGAGLLVGALAGAAVLLTVLSRAHIQKHKAGSDFISEAHRADMRALDTSNKTEDDTHRADMHALDKSNKTGADLQKHLRTHLSDARKTVREEVIKLKSKGKSIQEIKDAGYTKQNLGCEGHENEAEALGRCLEHLKTAFDPLELDELLGMESETELKMLVDAGMPPKTGDWKKDSEVVVCFTNGKKEGCFKCNVSVVSDDEISLRHLEFDPKTGTTENGDQLDVDPKTGKTEKGDYKFQAYTLEQWEKE